MVRRVLKPYRKDADAWDVYVMCRVRSVLSLCIVVQRMIHHQMTAQTIVLMLGILRFLLRVGIHSMQSAILLCHFCLSVRLSLSSVSIVSTNADVVELFDSPVGHNSGF